MNSAVSAVHEHGHAFLVRFPDDLAFSFDTDDEPRDVTAWIADLVLLGALYDNAISAVRDGSSRFDDCDTDERTEQLASAGNLTLVTATDGLTADRGSLEQVSVTYLNVFERQACELPLDVALELAASGIRAQLEAAGA